MFGDLLLDFDKKLLISNQSFQELHNSNDTCPEGWLWKSSEPLEIPTPWSKSENFSQWEWI